MRDDITLLYLKNHAPSTKVKDDLEFWFERNPLVTLHMIPVDSNYGMKTFKKKYKFVDLPCVVTMKGKKRQLFYGDDINILVREYRKKWEHLK